MLPYPRLAFLLWLPIFLIPCSLAAQSSNYHLEFLDDGHGNSDTHLVNDGPRVIEAYRLLESCDGKAVGATGGDILDYPYGAGAIKGLDGGPSRTIGLAPGGFWDLGFRMQCGNGKQNAQVNIDAVIFADGSFAGRRSIVRTLKASRDGIVIAVGYWMNRLAGENPDGSALGALLADAKNRETEDSAGQRKHLSLLPNDEAGFAMRAYWDGRSLVDSGMAAKFRTLTAAQPKVNIGALSDYIASWNDKISHDAALRQLNSAFPPVSDRP